MKPIIRVENLSKQYRIGARRNSYMTLRETLAGVWRTPLKGVRLNGRAASETIWALKDVSFEMQPGEVVGVIGRNGAGKSTLLKILARITEPDTGRVKLYGRVGSLLEVGTGFHPELTGRENIYLNGAILGMKRIEIERKFDEIVVFAEIEKFLDTPVKYYSSGMYMRLAFAVAAHLEPEILLVDEVLAVGDTAFQKKCLGKMEDVAKQGRTVLFVSHQLGMIAQLCGRALLMKQGRVAKEGDTQDVISCYLNEESLSSSKGFIASPHSDKDIYISRVQAVDSKGEQTTYFTSKEQIVIAITCKIKRWVSNSVMGFYIRDKRGRKVFTNINTQWANINANSTDVYTTVTIPSNFLVPGQYIFTFAISVPHVSEIDLVEDALTITVIDEGGSLFSSHEGHDYGCVFADCRWRTEFVPKV